MASLMEDFMDILDKENSEYQILLELSKKKTPVIIKGDVQELQKITDEEQIVVDRVSHLDRKREETLNDIANVINKDVETLKIPVLIKLLQSRPKEARQLSEIHDALKETLGELVRINDQNRELIKQSLEMVEFDLNLVQAMRQAPVTGNYDRGAYNAGSVMGPENAGFDAKQ